MYELIIYLLLWESNKCPFAEKFADDSAKLVVKSRVMENPFNYFRTNWN
jgi:hypothetical protein